MTTKEQKIKEIIDTQLKRWVDIGLNRLPVKIEDEMVEPNQDKTEEWRMWYPIDSRITKQEIEEFEKQVMVVANLKFSESQKGDSNGIEMLISMGILFLRIIKVMLKNLYLGLNLPRSFNYEDINYRWK